MATLDRSSINLNARTAGAFAVVLLSFLVVLVRLWWLQMLQGDYYRDRSENNRLRTIFVPPPRGIIYDRHGRVLVQNRPSFNIDLVSEDSPDPRESLRKLARVLGVADDTYLSQLQSQKKRRRYEPKLILKDVSRDVVARVSARLHELPGIVINIDWAREYLHGSLAAHLLGYSREITKEQLDSPRFRGYDYRQGDVVGQYGLEERWELDLQGRRGVEGVIVNAAGIRIDDAFYEPEKPGRNLTLTIDLDVQRAADTALAGRRGAIVALDPRNGEVLALSSAPTFDPNMFTGEIDPAAWRNLVAGPDKILNNRAVQGVYPPASVFKTVMAVAGLAEGVVDNRDSVNCPGFHYVGSRKFRCHKLSGHGVVNLEQALIKSCDVYFYTLGARLGVDRIHDYAGRFGFGKPTGLNLVTESPGLVPSTAWKFARFKEKWYPGETPSVSIGQGAITVTPLQSARAMAALVNGGVLYRPHLVKAVESVEGIWTDAEAGAQIAGQVGVDQAILREVMHGLKGVVNDPGGTGRTARLPEEMGIIVAGKTGTAQAVSADSGLKGHIYEDHAWFAGYAPADNPEIVIVALIENGGHGGVTAAPIVRDVMKAYFTARYPDKAAAVTEAVPAPTAAPVREKRRKRRR